MVALTPGTALSVYLDEFGVVEDEHRLVVSQRVAAEAERFAGDETELQMALERRTALWIGALTGADPLPHGRVASTARAAYWLCAGPIRWPSALLDPDPSAEFVGAMLRGMPICVPALRPALMLPQSLDAPAVFAPLKALRAGIGGFGRVFGRGRVGSGNASR